MNKNILLLITLVTLVIYTNHASAQYAFQDARALENTGGPYLQGGKVHLPKDVSFVKMMEPYVPVVDSSDIDAIKNDFALNPYIQFDAEAPAVARFKYKPHLSLPGSITSLDVTNIANGLSALLVDRAKQELTIAFFNHFQKFAAQHPEFGLLFPTTTSNLTRLLTFSYPQVLPILRNGFFSDLRALPGHLPGLLNIDPYKQFFSKYPELAITIRSLALIAEVQSGASTPPEIINEFAKYPEWNNPDNSSLMKNIGANVQLAALISQSLRSNNDDQLWVYPVDLKNLATDTILSNLYLGLLWQEANKEKITFYPDPKQPAAPVLLTTLLQNIQPDVQPLTTRVNEFIILAGQIGDGYNTILSNKKAGKANTNTDYYNYVGLAIDAIDTAFGIVDIFYPDLNAKPYLNLARSGDAIYKDIYSQQYTQAISDGLDFLDQIGVLANAYTQATAARPAPINSSNLDADSAKIMARARADANAAATAKSNALEKLSEFVEKIKPYVIFMANIAEAQSAADVTAALNNAILPVGSSSIKKITHNNLAIQAYLGAYWVTQYTSSSVTGVWAERFGVTAPIGFSYTPGIASQGKYGSLSLFLEVFDLGAIVGYQLKTDTVANSSGTPTTAVSKNYSVQLGQIFSPGGYIVYGAGANLPLALGFGGQYGPGLSKINASGQATVTNPSWRWNLFLTVDLPLFNILNVTKSKQP
jgi:hypothetical protein